MAEAVRILFTDKELTYKVLVKQLRISDPSAGRGLRRGNQNRGTEVGIQDGSLSVDPQ
jgi:hypothetical protein